MNQIKENIETQWRHIRNVQEDAKLLADRLMEKGDLNTARILLANSLRHDASKFEGIEFEAFILGHQDKLAEAIKHHRECNVHHPEWHPKGILSMSDPCVAEMICDWKDRSASCGETGLRVWIDEEATKIWGFSKQDKIYERIQFFLDLLLTKPLRRIS